MNTARHPNPGRKRRLVAASILLLGTALGELPAQAGPPGHGNPLLQPHGLTGFVVLAEQRYDPAVQRYMAQQSLRALPLYDGQLFYIYPRNAPDGYLEQTQIRYLEVLLRNQAADKAADEARTDEPDSAPALPTQ